jgi:hypothetical protein
MEFLGVSREVAISLLLNPKELPRSYRFWPFTEVKTMAGYTINKMPVCSCVVSASEGNVEFEPGTKFRQDKYECKYRNTGLCLICVEKFGGFCRMRFVGAVCYTCIENHLDDHEAENEGESRVPLQVLNYFNVYNGIHLSN